jgi:hypothetical protein
MRIRGPRVRAIHARFSRDHAFMIATQAHSRMKAASASILQGRSSLRRAEEGPPMPEIKRLAISLSRRLRLAALTFIALLALKITLAAFAAPEPSSASAVIVSAANHGVPSETLERLE